MKTIPLCHDGRTMKSLEVPNLSLPDDNPKHLLPKVNILTFILNKNYFMWPIFKICFQLDHLVYGLTFLAQPFICIYYLSMLLWGGLIHPLSRWMVCYPVYLHLFITTAIKLFLLGEWFNNSKGNILGHISWLHIRT